MSIRKRVESCPAHRDAPEGLSLSEVDVRLARPEERPLRDALMDGHGRVRYSCAIAGRTLYAVSQPVATRAVTWRRIRDARPRTRTQGRSRKRWLLMIFERFAVRASADQPMKPSRAF